MTTIRSTWTQPTPPPLTGLLDAADWSSAARMAIPRGTLLARNDGTHLYIGLDLTAETGAADPSDYFWFVVDINDNGVIDANRDKLFSDWPGSPSRLGMWLMAGPDETFGAPNTQVIPSQVRQGFGASLLSATPHRQWQIAFALSDLGIAAVDPTVPSPIVRFGLRIASSSFTGETPTNPLASFLNFNEIVLSPAPSIVVPDVGPVIASVGLIGTGLIGPDGYCNIPTTLPGYALYPQDAAFGGTLDFIGNRATLAALWAAGARKYKVMYRYGTTGTWAPILQTWSNFEIVGTSDVWQAFAPDSGGFYTMVDPALPYTIQNLVFQWTTSAAPDGVHQFELQFFNSAGGAVGSTSQVLTLRVDNQPTTAKMIDVLHAGTSVPPCSIVNLSSATDGVQLVYEAFDPEGDLWTYSVTAEYGAGVTSTIYADSYVDHRSATHNWQGVSSATQPPAAPGWVPPYTCAYLFQIQAWKRTTSGYQFPLQYSSDFKTVTLIKPNVIFKPLALSGPSHLAPAGFETAPTGEAAPRTALKALPIKKG